MAKNKQTPLGKLLSRLPFKFSGQKPDRVQEIKPLPPSLKLVFFIIEWSNAKIISGIFEEEKVRFHYISKGRGTASSDILDLLGIGASDKAVVICLEQDVMVPVLLQEVRRALGFHNSGAGIAFTVPLSGINTPILRVFKESVHQNEKITGAKEAHKMNDIKHDLVISIINQGYSDELMAVAREAGAGGGTVINARGLAHQGPVKFFGVSMQNEREIIIILVGREKKATIMESLSSHFGVNSKAAGLIFSLPVDQVMSLNLLADV